MSLVTGSALLLFACADRENAPPSVQTPQSCSALVGMTAPPASIGLPTNGAVVTEATIVAANATGQKAAGEYCTVIGHINPIDPKAPPIRFQIDLPTAWNSKIMMFGGGGYDGMVRALDVNVPAGSVDHPTPLGRGYAVFMSDSGHQANRLGGQDGSFGVNDEALKNFAGDALKKTRDAAVHFINAYYSVNGPTRAYFAGGSTGGREALAVTQRWPEDWDGIIALYPAWNAASLDLQFGRITRALAAPGAYPNPMERKRLYDAAMAVCDPLDGVEDGVISNVEACNALFNPSTAILNGSPLRCEGGRDLGDMCLSDAQIVALNVYDTPITFNFPLASGETQYPGFNVWGTDLGNPNAEASQAVIATLALGSAQPAHPMPDAAPYMSVFWDQWIRFFVTRDANHNSLRVDPQDPGLLRGRIGWLAGVQDVNKTDLSAFAAKGGKILMAHGSADALVSPRATAQYYLRLQETMGEASVRNFVRYYEIPGYGHVISKAFNASWDSLTTLENWVEKGTSPSSQIVTDTLGVPGRTRPLCEYPSWPRYNGSGDVNKAASFACALE